jgi:hypothetical protein
MTVEVEKEETGEHFTGSALVWALPAAIVFWTAVCVLLAVWLVQRWIGSYQ